MSDHRSHSLQEVPPALAIQLRSLKDSDNAVLNALLDAWRRRGWRTPTLARALQMNPAAVSKRIERARRAAAADSAGPFAAERQRVQTQLAGYVVPPAPQIQAMIDGRRLPPAKIAELRAMQQIASRVNGAMPPDHPSRRVGEAFTAELQRLLTEQQITPYYLAQVLGISHRAITSRLERHHYRKPCPSVAGTPSGQYRNRKIGDPESAVPA